jgi:hypothetical protein
MASNNTNNTNNTNNNTNNASTFNTRRNLEAIYAAEPGDDNNIARAVEILGRLNNLSRGHHCLYGVNFYNNGDFTCAIGDFSAVSLAETALEIDYQYFLRQQAAWNRR